MQHELQRWSFISKNSPKEAYSQRCANQLAVSIYNVGSSEWGTELVITGSSEKLGTPNLTLTYSSMAQKCQRHCSRAHAWTRIDPNANTFYSDARVSSNNSRRLDRQRRGRRRKITWNASHSRSFLGIFLQRESNDDTISDITASSSSAEIHKTSRYLSRS